MHCSHYECSSGPTAVVVTGEMGVPGGAHDEEGEGGGTLGEGGAGL